MLSSGITAVAVGHVLVSLKDVRAFLHDSRHDSLRDSLSVENFKGFCNEDFDGPMDVIVGI